jgi:glutamate/tyrosine decarboxylase-like PLP-dependent enzyme
VIELAPWLERAINEVRAWADTHGAYASHPSLEVSEEQLTAAFDVFGSRLRDNYPFFHPRYAGQMLKPPHPVAVVGYLTAMLINPNNHALDGGPATAAMEREVVADLAAMFGMETHLGHLTSSGTIANLEALYVARETHPDRGIAYSADSHYTHARMCSVLSVEGHSVAVDRFGRMDLDALESLLRTGRIGTVVLTAGTTGLGAIDPIDGALPLAERYGVRLHVDAAYGGFFSLLGRHDGGDIPSAPWRAIARCDSVVVDPHKHGLQPYGCGAVLFRDPGVGRFYVHDSPYTYFTSGALHLGEISLECSRAGASAAALWLTLRLLPLTRDGLGAVLAAGRRAAVRWAGLIASSEWLELYQQPELDIVTLYPRTGPHSLTTIDAASATMLELGMHDEADPVFLSVLRTDASAFAARHPGVAPDAGTARIVRSVLMKPESEMYVDWLHSRVERLARDATTTATPSPGPAGASS